MTDFNKTNEGLGAYKPEIIKEANACVQMDVDNEEGEPVVLLERINREVEDTAHVSVSRESSFKRNRPGPRSTKRSLDRESADEDSRSLASKSVRETDYNTRTPTLTPL